MEIDKTDQNWLRLCYLKRSFNDLTVAKTPILIKSEIYTMFELKTVKEFKITTAKYEHFLK